MAGKFVDEKAIEIFGKELVLRWLRIALTVALGFAGGCEVKSFLNPGEVGRWNKEPLAVPILDTLDVGIEQADSEFVNATDPRPEDLVATSADYSIGRNDLLTISITDLVAPGIETIRQARVSESGRISLPLIGQIQAMGKTEAQLETDIAEAYRDANLIQNAQVTVSISELQSRTFSIRGGVRAPGRYAIISSDFRLLDALVLAQDVNDPLQEYIYIIRRTDLAEPAGAEDTGEDEGVAPDAGEDPLAPPQSKAAPADDWVALLQAAPTTEEEAPAEVAADEVAPATQPADDVDAAAGQGRIVIIDGKEVLIEDGEMTETPADAVNPAADDSDAMVDDADAMPGEADDAGEVADDDAAQPDFEFNGPEYVENTRVIRIPYQPLNDGDLKYNVVIKPFDMIVVPDPAIGEYYMGGHVNVTGVYSLTGRKINLKQAVISARGLDGVAIPSRTEIIRRVEDNKEIFVRVDLDKIFSGTQPDIYLKPNDIVNVGTNFVAPFIAAVRNGFRMTYGFGFLYDRNFYDDDEDEFN